MKHITALIMTLLTTFSGYSQTKFPYDSVSHQVIYTESFRINPRVKTDDVYAAALTWFDYVSRFTHKNATAPLDTVTTRKPNKKKIEAEEQFANPRPLQMQDPAGGKIQGMGIIRYYSTANSIKLLYLKYDIGVKVEANSATVSVSNMHYFHYNPTSYKQVPLYNFSGGKPCEEVGAMESLIACENFHEEFKTLAAYCNKQIYGHISEFKSILRQKRYLYEGTLAKANVKSAAKTPAKATVKPPVKRK